MNTPATTSDSQTSRVLDIELRDHADEPVQLRPLLAGVRLLAVETYRGYW